MPAPQSKPPQSKPLVVEPWQPDPIHAAPRIARLRQELVKQDLAGIWITKPENVRWICGFTGSNGQVLLTPDSAVLFTDRRYNQQSAAELAGAGLDPRTGKALVKVEMQPGPPEALLGPILAPGSGDLATAATVTATKVHRLAVEAEHLTVGRHELLKAALPGYEIVVSNSPIDVLRQHKDVQEQGRLRRAADIADRALAEHLDLLREGVTEHQLAAELDHRMKLLGASDISFETIVASGPNSAIPHHRPTDRSFCDGDLVVVDFGAKVDGYGSDMTRTYVIGGQPTKHQEALYNAVAQAQAAGVAAIRPGVELAAIDSACRSILAKRGYGEEFIHGTGHGIGLEIHEQPMLSAKSVGILSEGLIVTVEPGAYIPGFGGVRIEDSVVVTASGSETITRAPKGLITQRLGSINGTHNK